jgi:hypothetical protein
MRHAVIDHRAYARVAMQDLGTAAGRRISSKGRSDIPLDQRANSGELGSECVHDAIDLIWSEPLARSLGSKQHGAAPDLLAQSSERRRKVCGYRRLTIGSNAEFTRKERRTQLGQHAGDLSARWSVACRHRTTREGSVGGGQCAT